ncbi:MAG: FAD-binding protein [Nitrospinaceae bacterium]|nr:NAD(P)/FAD-dependent oxidoreductase [Nitrospinaceae bacterium]NIR53755.1 NAD(P)/FAD-dependent oxidoreductase [Nitrospinaceae bacterium]NIS84167.1 NAD(P)/FAD-dependent oxidoreductase [Nitrospinaceae bacterium]NIT80970.1 NAD(P)/FAD-dependent oxidoreductase [Nitrospinaceae bacterium]NIU43263.1 NAD(P)/FAD-dependent oxidoreductase [Nitrospinaceae bacterium]
MKSYEVIIVGAGPAGCATALFMRQQGRRVLVLERAVFPRDKVCGEFISPAADDLLAQLGVLQAIEESRPVRLKGVAVSSYGKPELCIDYPPCPERGRPMTSLSLPRYQLDHLLVRNLRKRGVEVRERHAVDDFLFDDDRVTGVRGRDAGNRPFEFKSSVVVDASGRNGLSLRRLRLKKPQTGPGKIALAAHWEGVRLPREYCYMHISSPGYTGMAQVGRDSVNVVLVVDAPLVKGQEIDAFYQNTVLQNELRRSLLAGGRLAERVRTVESLSYAVRPVPCGGLVLAGDTTGFIDPFTGEGIYLSLRSAQLAAGVIDRAFQEANFSAHFLSRYERLRSREFDRKFMLSRILQKLIYRPRLSDGVVWALRRNPDLARTLAGVIGDYYPAERVVSWRFLGKTLRGVCSPKAPGSTTQPCGLHGVGE